MTASLGKDSQAFVEGKANAKANFLMNWNHPFTVGSTPWCAIDTHFIFVDGEDRYQYEIGSFISINNLSRPSSTYFNFTQLADLRDRYIAEYFRISKPNSVNLNELSLLIDEIFKQNNLALSYATQYHLENSIGITSADYTSPILAKYDRITHDDNKTPKIEVTLALLHYEKAIIEFNELKACRIANKLDEAFSHGVYCTIAVAASLEAIANNLIYIQTGEHPQNWR